MKTIKVSEASGTVLDWLVAKCEPAAKTALELLDRDVWNGYAPSADWAQGGPIIERERIATIPSKPRWVARIMNPKDPLGDWLQINGPTPLVAAMRCYCASKLGDEVEVPDELHPGSH